MHGVHVPSWEGIFLWSCGWGCCGVGAVAVSARGAGPVGQRLVMLLQTHKQTITWVCSPAERRAGTDRQPQHYPYWISPPCWGWFECFGMSGE